MNMLAGLMAIKPKPKALKVKTDSLTRLGNDVIAQRVTDNKQLIDEMIADGQPCEVIAKKICVGRVSIRNYKYGRVNNKNEVKMKARANQIVELLKEVEPYTLTALEISKKTDVSKITTHHDMKNKLFVSKKGSRNTLYYALAEV